MCRDLHEPLPGAVTANAIPAKEGIGDIYDFLDPGALARLVRPKRQGPDVRVFVLVNNFYR